MSAVTVPAETGVPFTVKLDGNRIKVSRPSEFNGFTHMLVYRPAEALAVADAMVDAVEQLRQDRKRCSDRA